MEIQEPVKVRNPHGVVYWVERARLPELLRQGFTVVEPEPPGGEDGAPKKRQRKRKVKDGPANDG